MQNNQALKAAGLKVTAPRLKILDMLKQANPHHMSAEDMYQNLHQAGEDVALATVYRVLTQFEAVGLIERHNFEGGFSIFELTADEHHDHLVCTTCGHVEEFTDPIIEEQQKAVAKKIRFHLTDHRLTLYGLCFDCQIGAPPSGST